MMRKVFGYLKRRISPKKFAKVEPLKVTEAVYRDELTNKKQQPPKKTIVKKTVRFADAEPTILGEEKCISEDNEWSREKGEGNQGIRVKVKMTKEEAFRLLSKCNNNGGVLEFKDVARELVSFPTNRVCVVSPYCPKNNNLHL
ncbi:uncharacterized protein LOC107474229 [Arachis duranensis]|uniref:Uncharacterized protein LOC107474229 n=1 Tax=Arachis duranensis TaxID=130453 RepID=A0A6P4CDJ3_ARADU|nr:uncharacterized protein LOC107474229 [Arachis duranensis]